MLTPALLKTTCRPPQRSTVASVYAWTWRPRPRRPRRRRTPRRRSPADRPATASRVDVDAGDPGALLGEPDRRRPADPRTGAGDDRHLAGQPIAHRPPSCRRPDEPHLDTVAGRHIVRAGGKLPISDAYCCDGRRRPSSSSATASRVIVRLEVREWQVASAIPNNSIHWGTPRSSGAGCGPSPTSRSRSRSSRSCRAA